MKTFDELFAELSETARTRPEGSGTVARLTYRGAHTMVTLDCDDLTLEANRQRQAEITQEIMEVVAGAESLV